MLDPCDDRTWPETLRTEVAIWSKDVGSDACWQDAAIPLAVSELLEHDLQNETVLTFHCARLLRHELDLIRREGLRPFSRSLFDRKIAGAQHSGSITPKQADGLSQGNMYGCGDLPARGNREGQVWLNAGLAGLNDDPEAFSELLLHWGGEGIYFATGTTKMRPLLRSLGTPTIVLVALPAIARGRPHSWWGPFGNLLLAGHRGIAAHSDVVCWSEVEPSAVLGFWQPGDESYDRFQHLPQD